MDTNETHAATVEAPGLPALPQNIQTGRPYQGENIGRLLAAAADAGYSSPIWGGYGQLQDAGWQVRRGEKSTEILAVFGRGDAGDDASGDRPANVVNLPTVGREPAADRGRGRRGGGVRVVRVFNIAQCDRLTPEQVEQIKARRAAKAERAAARKAAGKGRKRKNRKKK